MSDYPDELLDQARTLEAEGHAEAAIAKYRQIIGQYPDWAAAHYNLGLLHKYRHEWVDSMACNRRAAELDPEDDAAWWNMGIAATALSDWLSARQAWSRFGLKLEETDEPIEANLGITPLRLTNGEVVWGRRICPARTVIQNIPLPESGHRFQDVVLNDGAPSGTRVYDGREYPVFDELLRLEPSLFLTFSAEVLVEEEESLDTLAVLCDEAGMGCENWTQSVRMLCRQCSEGAPHDDHDEELDEERLTGAFQIAIAATGQEEVDEVLTAWKAITGEDVLALTGI